MAAQNRGGYQRMIWGDTVTVTTTPPKRLLVPMVEAQAQLGGIGRTLLWELCNRGELEKVHIGRRGFITAESLSQFVNRLRAAAAGT